jgi:hypothetical protein
MAKPQSTHSRHGLAVISVSDPLTIRRMFRKLGHTSRDRKKLRSDIFGQVARSEKLQHRILEALAKHPETQRDVVMELTSDSRFLRRLLVLAGSAD